MASRSSSSTAFPNRTAPGARSPRRSPADFRVIAPDQRGFGASDKPEGVENYRADKVVEDLIALADALGLGRFTLVGHDWGGAVAWLAALAPSRPDRAPRHRQRAPSSGLPEEPDRGRRPARRLAIYQRLPQSGDGAGDRGDGPGELLRQDLRQPCRRLAPAGGGEAGLSRRLVGAGRADRDAELVPGERDRRAGGRRGGRGAGLDQGPLPASRRADAGASGR